MASSSVSQDDHDVEHDFALASRRAKVRSARANRTVNLNSIPCKGLGEEVEREMEGGESHANSVSKYYDPVLVETNDASSPRPIIRGITKDKRSVPRGGHAGKTNKGVRDRRKLREKRRSTAIGVMHLPSTESTGGSTGEDENDENSVPVSNPVKPATLVAEPEEKFKEVSKGKSESDLDADDEAAQDSSDVRTHKEDDSNLKSENHRLTALVEVKDKRIATLEMQVAQLTRQLAELKEDHGKFRLASNANI